jgi:hypothetical protein
MTDDNYCTCGRILQPGWATELGICDHCREVPVIEGTELMNRNFRAKISDKVKVIFSKVPEVCDCDYCHERWERYS